MTDLIVTEEQSLELHILTCLVNVFWKEISVASKHWQVACKIFVVGSIPKVLPGNSFLDWIINSIVGHI